jgi:hypothetical protein
MAQDDPGSMFIQGMLSGQQYKLNNFLLQEAPVKLESEKLALKVAQSDYDKRQKMAELLSQGTAAGKVAPGQNPLNNAAEALVQMGGAAAKVGLVDEAVSDLSKASTIMAQQEDAAYKQWQTTLQQTKYADQLLAGVTDQATLDAANAHIKMTTGKDSALAGMKYSPELIADLQKASLSKRTAAQEALTRAQTRKAEIEADAAKELGPLRKTQEDLNIARTEAAKKVGGDGLIAQPKNITAVTNEIRKTVGDDNISVGDARTFANDIALDAEQRMKRDHITQEQAVNAAVKYANDHGVLAGIPKSHTAIGSSPRKPLPLPKEVSGYKDQKWYQAPDGPRWYDAETQTLYKAGEGPGDEEESDEGGEDKEE